MQIQLHNRISRVRGQLDSLQKSIDEDVSCEVVIPQFLAVKGALNAAFEQYVHSAILECGNNDKKQLADLIHVLIKK